jgi:nucleotide-binding universal stress UspA family protein
VTRSATNQTPPPIVAGSALDARSDEVVAAAWKMAAATGSELVIVHAVPLPHLVPGMPVQPVHPIETLAARAQHDLEEQARRLRPAGSPQALLRVETGVPDAVLANAALELGARLMVLGATTSHGRLGKLLGSTAERLLQAAPAPVLVVRDELPVPPRTVLAPLDLSMLAYDAFVSGLELLRDLDGDAAARRPAIRCEMLCVVAPLEGEKEARPAALQQAQAGIESIAAQVETPGVRFAPRVLAGEPRDQILRTLEELDCDLVLLGTRGAGGLHRRLGVVATDVAREAPCSVLLIPPAKSFGDALARAVDQDLSPNPPGRRKEP